MKNELENKQDLVWRESLTLLLASGVVLALLIFIFNEGLSFMVELWATREEYGHGYMIPFITGPIEHGMDSRIQRQRQRRDRCGKSSVDPTHQDPSKAFLRAT